MLWLLEGDARVEGARAAIEDARTSVLVSSVSVWEAAIKSALGKLRVPDNLPERLDEFAENLEPLAGHPVSATTASGDPANALLAREGDRPGATLIVVGARGFGAARRLLLGSVSTKLIHSGHSPLLVVPAWPEKPPEPRLKEAARLMSRDRISATP